MFNRFAETMLQLEHRHSDGSWGRLERAAHDPAGRDPERDWEKGELYICPHCSEQVRVRHQGDTGASGTGSAK